MPVFKLLLFGLIWFLRIYYYIIIAYILLGWIPEIRRSKLYSYLHQITNPYLGIFRGLIVVGMMDFTPIIGLLIYNFGLEALIQVFNTI